MEPAIGSLRRSAVWSVVRFGLLVVLISLTLSLFVTPWVERSWWSILRRCVSIASAVSLSVCITQFEKRSIQSYGFSDRRAGKRELVFGLGLGFSALGILLGLGLATGACQISLTPDRVKLWRTVLGFLPAALLVGVLEELVFRGFILQPLLAWSRPVAVSVSSLLYALVHLKTATVTLTGWLELGGLFLLGNVLALSYLKTQQLYLAIGLHAVLAYGARVNKLLIKFPDPSLSWLVGTSRLVNGLMSWIVLLGMAAVILRWGRKAAIRGSERAPSAGLRGGSA